MSGQTFHPVTTSIGLLRGRDAIYMDSLRFDGGNLTLDGECNGHLLTPRSEKDPRYSLCILGVMAHRVIELDTWEHRYYQSNVMENSFAEVCNSEWLAELIGGGKVTPSYRHLVIQTYDFVIEAICQEFEFSVVGSS